MTTTAVVKAAAAVVAPPATDRIVWVQARGTFSDLWTMSGSGGDSLRLTFGDARNREPSWSRDGKAIVFTSDREGNNDIYSMRSDGGNPTRLTSDAANDYAAAWSPDGRSIAFVSNRNGNDELYVMRADGSQQTRLTDNGGFDGQPAWSPDGKLIAFTSSRDRDLNIFVIPAAGGAVSRLTTDKADDRDAAWSPDGSALAFASNRSGQFQVYTMKNDGSDQRKLTSVTKGAEHPAWGPATIGRSGMGAWLLSFVGYSGSGGAASAAEIWLMRGDGSEQKALMNNDVEDVDPAWFIMAPPLALATQPALPTVAATVRPAMSPTVVTGAPTAVATPQPAVAAVEILVDELSAQFSRGGTAKYWKEAKVGFGNHMIFTYNARTADNWGRWTPALPQPGTYEVLVYIPGQNATTQKAAYTIVHAGAQEKKIINQALYENTWLSLGTYPFTAQGKEYVQLSDVTGEAVNTKRIGFDAMKFVYKSP
jgi:dipeptidyl aminopeptidase/acylaminoacyl peptidase